jgi:hypothetical protein
MMVRSPICYLHQILLGRASNTHGAKSYAHKLLDEKPEWDTFMSETYNSGMDLKQV